MPDMATRSTATPVCLEIGTKKVFASAIEWPGWSRAGKTEDAALAALVDYVPRYAVVATHASVAFPARIGDALTVVQRLNGGAGTDFGVPSETADAERRATTTKDARRLAALVTAAWTVFDEVVAGSPAQLRKGPRGGGRDRDAMVDHVLGAEAGYARKIGIAHKPPTLDDIDAVEAMREDIAAVLATPSTGAPLVEKGWTVRYAARRIAWHVLDHAWEMQDRAEPE
jgi:hypothetical protein